MPVELYNVVFTGELVEQTAPEIAQRKLAALFRLDGTQLEQLFSGRRIHVKRNLDLDTAARLQDAFRRAGGKAVIEPVDAMAEVPEPAPTKLADADHSALTLAPVGALLEQLDDPVEPQSPDISALSLVSGEDWTLADCGPPAPPHLEFDLDDLELVPMAAPATGPDAQRDA